MTNNPQKQNDGRFGNIDKSKADLNKVFAVLNGIVSDPDRNNWDSGFYLDMLIMVNRYDDIIRNRRE